jgi:hypothetical protein
MLSREVTDPKYISVYWDWEEVYWHRVCRERFAICVCIVMGPVGHLAPYGRRKCLVSTIRDSEDTHR